MERYERMSKKRIAVIIVFSILIVLNVTFIFCNSLQDADESSLMSSDVTGFFQKIIAFMNSDLLISEKVIRKIAHFIEFAALGGLCTIQLNCIFSNGIKRFFIPVVFGGIIAVIDENLQRFSVGRAYSVIDMLIDTSGVVFSVLVFSFTITVFRKKRRIL